MRRFEHRVFRVEVKWDGGDYYLGAMIEKDDRFPNVDHLGEQGWEFVAFVPNHEVYISDSFGPEQLPYVRLAVFKREVEPDKEFRYGVDRAD